MPRLSNTTAPAPHNLHEDVSPAVELEITESVENATAADFLLKPEFLRDLGFVGDFSGEVLRWRRELRKQKLIDALLLPGGWQISGVTAGTCTHCLRGAQTALLRSSPGGGIEQVILLCDEHEREALDRA